ncbi:hypothetical protein [Noviherbaspirillum massiliense]|uniref:hypothetical protein n=1 Tax=Noviherbaspirillum massiliense TaxID=1465823 RepID=UPI0003087BC0|nr:hypothetical protein [Noviherbaspirillum massiliense]
MATPDIRSEAVLIAEQAAWKQIQNLQRISFEKSGLLGLIELNELLIKNYRNLVHGGDAEGKNRLLARGMTALTFLTDLLPQIEQELAGKASMNLLLSCHEEEADECSDALA